IPAKSLFQNGDRHLEDSEPVPILKQAQCLRRRCALEFRRSRLCWASIAVLSMWMALLLPPLRAGSIEWSTAPLPQIQYQAEQLEEAYQWAKAGELWYQILARDRSYGQAKEHYQLCLRRAQQIARHQDASYRQQILTLPLESAIQVYGEVLAKLQ